MRLLTEDEIIHVPLGYYTKYGEEVPSLTPIMNEQNCVQILTQLLKTRLTFKEEHGREPTEDELTELLYTPS